MLLKGRSTVAEQSIVGGRLVRTQVDAIVCRKDFSLCWSTLHVDFLRIATCKIIELT